MIQIANPIYDVVFKFMMSDNKVAKLLLSAIIGNEIIDLKFEPTETQLSVQESITVLRMDFKATVQYEDGSRQVIIIELQKAKLHTDIMRFRRYLGKQYSDKNNSIILHSYTNSQGKLVEKRKAIPIVSIYFLGYPVEGLENIPVIKVARNYVDIATNEIIKKKTDFIESLTHNSYVIQIPYVHHHRRTDLEQLLYIFGDSEEGDSEDLMTKHFLKIAPEEVPERYQPVLRRLIEAFANPKVRETMEAEDDILEELQDYTRLLEEKEEELKRKELKLREKVTELREKDTELREKDTELREKDTKLQEKVTELREKDTKLREKDTKLQQKDTELQQKDEAIIKAIKKMLALNVSAEEVAEMFGKSVEFVEKLK